MGKSAGHYSLNQRVSSITDSSTTWFFLFLSVCVYCKSSSCELLSNQINKNKILVLKKRLKSCNRNINFSGMGSAKSGRTLLCICRCFLAFPHRLQTVFSCNSNDNIEFIRDGGRSSVGSVSEFKSKDQTFDVYGTHPNL